MFVRMNHWSQCKGGGAVAQKPKMLGSAPNVHIMITNTLIHPRQPKNRALCEKYRTNTLSMEK